MGAMAQALARWLGGTMTRVQWRGHNGPGRMALAQAHLHRHGGPAKGTKTIAGHDGTGVIQWARWHKNNGFGTMARARHMS
jgi:hypothetical protein